MMKLKNSTEVIKLAGIAAVLACGVSGNTYAASDSATITITGKVVANTCTIDANSATQTITLADISDRDIKGAGKTGGAKEVNIVLKDCGDAIKNVIVTTSGTPDSDNSKAFANATSGGATGVALYFYQTDGSTVFTPDGQSSENSVLKASADNTLTYKASYVGTKDTVTAGAFSTVVNMKFEYQ